MAPFAVVAPVLGPLLDRTRGGRRLLIAASAAGRAVLCLLMAGVIHELALYPLAFAMLVLSKGHSVAKSALVPAVVDSPDELVRANSRLALIAVLCGAVAAPFAAAILKISSAAWVLRTGSLIFAVGIFAALAIPRARRRSGRPRPRRSASSSTRASIVIAGSAMGLVRGVVGFTTFFAAFVLKKQGEPAWVYGLVLIAGALGNAARDRHRAVVAQARAGGVDPRRFAGRARDPVAVRGARVRSPLTRVRRGRGGRERGARPPRLRQPLAARRCRCRAGRAFARYETRFQIVWVLGGLVAVLFFGGGRAGIFLVALVLLFGGLSYVGAVRRSEAPGTTPAVPPPPGVERKGLAGSVTQRLNRGPWRSKSARSDPTKSTT